MARVETDFRPWIRRIRLKHEMGTVRTGFYRVKILGILAQVLLVVLDFIRTRSPTSFSLDYSRLRRHFKGLESQNIIENLLLRPQRRHFVDVRPSNYSQPLFGWTSGLVYKLLGIDSCWVNRSMVGLRVSVGTKR